MIFFCENHVLVLNSLNMKRFLIYMISKLTEDEVAARTLLPSIFPVQTKQTRVVAYERFNCMIRTSEQTLLNL